MFSFFKGQSTPSVTNESKSVKHRVSSQRAQTYLSRTFNFLLKFTIGSSLLSSAQAETCFRVGPYNYSLESNAENSILTQLNTSCTDVSVGYPYYCPVGNVEIMNFTNCALGYLSGASIDPCLIDVVQKYCLDNASDNSWLKDWRGDLFGFSVMCFTIFFFVRSFCNNNRAQNEGPAVDGDNGVEIMLEGQNEGAHYVQIEGEAKRVIAVPLNAIGDTKESINMMAVAGSSDQYLEDFIFESSDIDLEQSEEKFADLRDRISHIVMQDPYPASDGYPYERELFLKILKENKNNISPLNKSLLSETKETVMKHQGSIFIRDRIHAAVLENVVLAKEFFNAHRNSIFHPNVKLGEVEFAQKFKKKYLVSKISQPEPSSLRL